MSSDEWVEYEDSYEFEKFDDFRLTLYLADVLWEVQIDGHTSRVILAVEGAARNDPEEAKKLALIAAHTHFLEEMRAFMRRAEVVSNMLIAQLTDTDLRRN